MWYLCGAQLAPWVSSTQCGIYLYSCGIGSRVPTYWHILLNRMFIIIFNKSIETFTLLPSFRTELFILTVNGLDLNTRYPMLQLHCTILYCSAVYCTTALLHFRWEWGNRGSWCRCPLAGRHVTMCGMRGCRTQHCVLMYYVTSRDLSGDA